VADSNSRRNHERNGMNITKSQGHYLNVYDNRVIVCETATGRVVCGFDMHELLGIAAAKELADKPLAPTRPGQPLFMTVSNDPLTGGHWYSPEAVAAALAKKNEEAQAKQEPVADVPVHPREGLLWANVRPRGAATPVPNYPLQPLYLAPQSSELPPVDVPLPEAVGLLDDVGREHVYKHSDVIAYGEACAKAAMKNCR
jgi:hypothetical protein